ncbi:hypothetical protein ACNKHS_01825 [Shigella flexneri]
MLKIVELNPPWRAMGRIGFTLPDGVENFQDQPLDNRFTLGPVVDLSAIVHYRPDGFTSSSLFNVALVNPLTTLPQNAAKFAKA